MIKSTFYFNFKKGRGNTIKWFKRLICKKFGHKWDYYTVQTGYWSYDIEQAGYCKRCGYDTHGEYEK